MKHLIYLIKVKWWAWQQKKRLAPEAFIISSWEKYPEEETIKMLALVLLRREFVHPANFNPNDKWLQGFVSGRLYEIDFIENRLYVRVDDLGKRVLAVIRGVRKDQELRELRVEVEKQEKALLEVQRKLIQKEFS